MDRCVRCYAEFENTPNKVYVSGNLKDCCSDCIYTEKTIIELFLMERKRQLEKAKK